ncbi:S8 family peptidase [Arthrobacter sp. ZGTC212]|uniref:S8 family serine peptidase n=1 Tax=Arthrobacter sp. ZGTC212 TaxID=2058899 RepID=UPI002157E411|nr:S8 family peptidase [Arthrobacter sp. ZGTC212]
MKISSSRLLLRAVTGAAALLLLSGPLVAAPASANGTSDAVPPSRYIVTFADRAAASSITREQTYLDAGSPVGAAVTELHLTGSGGTVVEVDPDLTVEETAAVVSALAADPDVERVEPDVLLYPSAVTPNDPLYPRQWNLQGAGGGADAAPAWTSSTGKGQVVAVVDTGITAHTDLQAQVLPGYDLISDPAVAGDGNGRDADPRDEGDWYPNGSCGRTVGSASTWHGTHVSGVVAASANNGTGISGVAPGAQILPVRTLGTCGGYMSDISDGIIWAAGGQLPGVPLNPTPARVINLSLGGVSTCSAAMQQAVNFAAERGAVVVAAAGNDSISADRSQPANCDNVMVVGATDRNGSRAPYSNFGPLVDLMAPGGNTMGDSSGGILSTINNGKSVPADEGYAYYQGTSMAAPHVAGAAALLLSADPGLTSQQVESTLLQTARELPGSCTPHCGPQLLNISAAVAAVASPFADVPKSMQFYDDMRWMAEAGISTGWTETNGTSTYRPLESVNRDAMAAFMYRLAGSPAFTPPQKSPFADVSTGNQFYKEISWLAAEEISTGWLESNGTKTYRPLQPVNRDAMAAFMYRYADSPAYTVPVKSPFADIAKTNQFYKEISWLASTGISTGWAGGNGTSTYRPLSSVKRDAMAAFMHRFDTRFN